eukprot:jgi/Phyca11/131954/e_gw1.122.28.1
MNEWHLRYQHIVDENDDREELCVAQPTWYLPEDMRTSLFCCLCYSSGEQLHEYIDVLTEYMSNLQDLDGLFDIDYITSLKNGETLPGELELFAAAHMHHWNIEVKTLDEDCKVVSEYTYTVDNPTDTVYLARINFYFTREVNGMHV